jgi:hypothetical protein
VLVNLVLFHECTLRSGPCNFPVMQTFQARVAIAFFFILGIAGQGCVFGGSSEERLPSVDPSPTPTPTATATPLVAGNAACVIRGEADLPTLNSPRVGAGYAMKPIYATDFAQARALCTDAVFADLMLEYQLQNSEEAQWSVAFYTSLTTLAPGTTSGCALSGCAYHPIGLGACVVRGEGDLPTLNLSLVGDGYAFKPVYATSLAEVLAICDDSAYSDLMLKYQAAGNTGEPQWQVAFYTSATEIAPGTTTGCAASGCDGHPMLTD